MTVMDLQIEVAAWLARDGLRNSPPKPETTIYQVYPKFYPRDCFAAERERHTNLYIHTDKDCSIVHQAPFCASLAH